ncbi:MAG: oligosaccharide flippase family protein [Solirubrobacterales bacterium]|nr:oligosaccharide flippase family protein [Solirubrobacterales bacterium]
MDRTVPADPPGGGARFDPSGGEGLRRRAARGTIINAAFLVLLNVIGFLKGFSVAAFLTVEDYAVWGLLVVSLATLLFLVQVGIDDKYIQQDEEDQEEAFQLAFTLQCLLCGSFMVVIALGMPLYALAYGTWEVLLPGYALTLALPAVAFQSPVWTFYRRMEYLQQRKLQAWDPLVSLVVTIALAAAGFGYWALVLGVVAGSWAAAAVAVRACPYPMRLRWKAGTLAEYRHFSLPLFLGSASGVLVAQVPVLIAQRTLGLAAVGVIALASTISAYANRVDEIVTDTIYPAVCAVKDRRELLRESFMKSNRLALLWAVPTGAGLVLFAPDLVTFLLGERWREAVFAIQVFGAVAAFNQIGFNWTAFLRALGTTGPVARAGAVMLAGVAAFAIPGLLLDGVDGYSLGMAAAVIGLVAYRLRYLGELFGLGGVIRNSALGAIPTVPGIAAVLLLRATEDGPRGEADALLELALLLIVTVLTTLVSERALLRELRGYLSKASAAQPA